MMEIRNDQLITPEEIAHIIAHVKTLDPFRQMQEHKSFPPKPNTYHLKSGYSVSYSIDIMQDFPSVHHVSVGHDYGKADPADAELIAKKILQGHEYVAFGVVYNPFVYHFFSCIDMVLLRVFLKNWRKRLNRKK